MARYIDVDKLIAHLKDEIEGCKQPFNSRANGKGIAYGTELGLKSAISFANTLATADVVPKSEVDKLEYTLAGVMHSVDKWLDGEELKQDEVNRAATMREKTLQIIENANSKYDEVLSNWQKIHDSYNADCIEHYNKGRQDSAREIFEEIEKIIDNNTYKSYLPNSSLWCKEYRSSKIVADIAKLKKKYTENVIVGEWKFDGEWKPSTEQQNLRNAVLMKYDDALDWDEAPPLEESEDEG